MRVSLVNVNLIGPDAIGSLVIQMARFFRERGDEVRIWIQSPPRDIPEDIVPLCRVVTLAGLMRDSHGRGGPDDLFFGVSDLVVYHYPIYYELLESIHGRDRGSVLFCYYCVTPPGLASSGEERLQLARGRQEAAHAHCADLVAVLSPFGRDELLENHGVSAERIRILPPFVNPGHFGRAVQDPSISSRGDRPTLLSVGRFARNKDLETSIRAVGLLKERGRLVDLVLVGDNHSAPVYRENCSRYERLASELGIREQIKIEGTVRDLGAYYGDSDLFVTASLHEGFCVPVVEAMVAGLPVISADAAALPSTVGNAGRLFSAGDPKSLARAIELLLDDPEERKNLVARGRLRASEYTLEQYKRRLEEVVRDLTAGMPPVSRLLSEEGIQEGKRRVAIVGASVGGLRAWGEESRKGSEIVCFADNDRSKQGSRFLGIPVLSLAEMAGCELDQVVVAVSARTSIRRQLEQLGVDMDGVRFADLGIADLPQAGMGMYAARIRELLNSSGGRHRPRVLLFGTGSAGMEAYGKVRDQYEVVGFLDNDPARKGTLVRGRRVFSPHQVQGMSFDTVLIASMHWPAMRRQLIEMGVAERQIKIYGES